MSRCRILFAAMGLALLLSSISRAALVTISNASFELPSLADGVNTVGAIPGWMIVGGAAGVWNPPLASYSNPLPDGVQIAYSNGGSLQQVLAQTLTAGTTYTLHVDVGHRNFYQFPGYQIGLYAGGNLLVQDNNSLLPVQNSFQTSTLTYHALAGNPFLGQALEIRLRALGDQVNFDHIRLDAIPPTSAVPEPASFVIWGLVGTSLAFGVVRRRRTCP